MQLRKGKTKTLLESSIDCALLSVEIYNKPRAPFRVESFITHMIMSWTRLLQAHFNQTIGETFFYKEHKKTVSRGYTKLMEPSGSLFVLTLILFNFLISFLLRVSFSVLRDVK